MKLLTTKDVAKALNMSEDSIRRLERIGRLPAARTESGIRLFKPADVERVKKARAEKLPRFMEFVRKELSNGS